MCNGKILSADILTKRIALSMKALMPVINPRSKPASISRFPASRIPTRCPHQPAQALDDKRFRSWICEIAEGLKWAASTVSREVARHGGRPRYGASGTDHQAWKLVLRPNACLLAIQRKVRTMVGRKRILNGAPGHVSG